MELRPYQRDAVREIVGAFRNHNKVLASLPTGCGKSCVAAYLANAWPDICGDYGLPDRVLWLAHMDTLIWQAVRHIKQWCGESPAVEKGKSTIAGDWLAGGKRITVSSVQTMMRENRRGLFQPDSFGLVFADECHHCPAEGWQKVIDYFSGAKVLGVTATCDRTDEVPLAKVFDTVAYHYELTDAIRDGWLAPVRQLYIHDVELDWSNVRRNGADLSADDLDAVLLQEEALHRMCGPIATECIGRQTLVFTPSVATAKAMAEVLGRYPGVRGVRHVSGAMPTKERRPIIKSYHRGEFQYLVSCDLLREGFDDPATSAVVNCRLTMSRLVYSQIVGRGLRGGPRCPVDGKTDLLVLDLVGSSMRHKLVTCADLLGGRWDAVVTDEADRRIREKSKDAPADVMAELREAAKIADELRAEQRRTLIAEARMKRKTIDPFVIFADAMELREKNMPSWWTNTPADDSQKAKLKSLGIDSTGLTYAQGKQLIDEAHRRASNGMATYKQVRMLRSRGFDTGMSLAEASDVMTYMATRPGGFSFIGHEDGPRRARAKKFGRGMRYSEMRWQYTIPAGAACQVRRIDGEWEPYQTRRVCQFRQVASRAGHETVFKMGDHELRIENAAYHVRMLGAR